MPKKKKTPPPKRLVMPHVAAKYLGVSLPTLRNMVRSGLLRAVRLGALTRYDKQDLDAFIERSKTQLGDDQ